MISVLLKQSHVLFLGKIFTPDGVKPDPKKVEAIKKMQAPQTKQELQSFLGMINYLGQFIKNMPELTSNLRSLLKKNTLFQWTESHETNFQKLKDSITSDSCLMDYNSKKPVTLQVDASQVGLGGVLLQEDNNGRQETSCICIQEPQPSREKVCQHRKRNVSSSMGMHKIPSLFIWQEVYMSDRSQASGRCSSQTSK